VLREAERALAEAKLAGKNCVRSYDLAETPPLDAFLPGCADPNRMAG
jgi:hypothetical protein